MKSNPGLVKHKILDYNAKAIEMNKALEEKIKEIKKSLDGWME